MHVMFVVENGLMSENLHAVHPRLGNCTCLPSRDSGFPVAGPFRAHLGTRAPAYLSARRSSGSSARARCGDGDARRKKIVGAREGQGVTWDVLCTR
jgi:hypothetical protein